MINSDHIIILGTAHLATTPGKSSPCSAEIKTL